MVEAPTPKVGAVVGVVLHAEGCQQGAQHESPEAEEPHRHTGPDEDEHHPRSDGEADRHGSLREEKQRTSQPRMAACEILLHLVTRLLHERSAISERELLCACGHHTPL